MFRKFLEYKVYFLSFKSLIWNGIEVYFWGNVLPHQLIIACGYLSAPCLPFLFSVSSMFFLMNLPLDQVYLE